MQVLRVPGGPSARLLAVHNGVRSILRPCTWESCGELYLLFIASFKSALLGEPSRRRPAQHMAVEHRQFHPCQPECRRCGLPAALDEG